MGNFFVNSLVAALVPLLVGFVWYNPKVFGNAWLKSIGKTAEEMRGANMALIFGLTYLFSYMICLALGGIVVHQMAIGSLIADGSPELQAQGLSFLEATGRRYNTFKHGAFHGVLAALFFALPVIGINALFERRGAKYIFIHLGYWVITLAGMGAIICHFTVIDGKM